MSEFAWLALSFFFFLFCMCGCAYVYRKKEHRGIWWLFWLFGLKIYVLLGIAKQVYELEVSSWRRDCITFLDSPEHILFFAWKHQTIKLVLSGVNSDECTMWFCLQRGGRQSLLASERSILIEFRYDHGFNSILSTLVCFSLTFKFPNSGDCWEGREEWYPWHW